jgi:predicted MPP superfamily phosphohydrolase
MLIREFISLTLFLCVVLAIYIKEASLILKLISHKLGRRQGPSGFLTKPAVVIHLISFAGVICLLYAMFIEPSWIEVKNVELSTVKFSKAHLRIVQISDLHCDPEARNEKKTVEIVNSLKPDIIVFTGDAVNTPGAIPLFKQTMKELKADGGKFAVTGNFDYWFLRGQDLFGGTGFQVLKKDGVKFTKDGESVCITGLDFGNGNKWREAVSKVPGSCYSVLLYHKPDLIEDIKGSNVDLYLCGHTHGGQIALPVYGAIITFARYGKRYEAGEYKVGNTVLYVNRGLGLEGKAPIKARFFARPEITVFDIKPEAGK